MDRQMASSRAFGVIRKWPVLVEKQCQPLGDLAKLLGPKPARDPGQVHLGQLAGLIVQIRRPPILAKPK